jgi:hypothetical protein
VVVFNGPFTRPFFQLLEDDVSVVVIPTGS